MKNKKLGLGIAMLLAIAFTACGQQYDSPSDFRVSPLDGGKSAEITEYVGNKQTVNIPPRIEGMPITKIGSGAFYGKQLIRVTIPNTVTVIATGAFASNSFTSITLPTSLTSIGWNAFYECTKLTSITIPAGVTSIGDSAFYNCFSLTSITLPTGLTEIGRGAFVNCTSLTSITIPVGVTEIGFATFAGWTSSQTIYIKGKASQAEADAVWYVNEYGERWRYDCDANIVYGQ